MPKTFSKTFLSTVARSNLGAHQHFASVFDMAHDTLEYFVIDSGITWDAWFGDEVVLVPIVEVNARYTAEMFSGKEVTIKLAIEKVGSRSVTIRYEFFQEDRPTCVVTFAHVFMDKKARKAIKIPETIKTILESYVL